MSTRANIIVTDGTDSLIFYRHSDGYPKGVMPMLERFLELIVTGKIRDNTSQAAGWLILMGAEEYGVNIKDAFMRKGYDSWKVGAIEPTTMIHGDIDHLYVVDLAKKKIFVDAEAEEHPEVKEFLR